MPYQLLNIIGSLLLVANTIFYRAYPSSFVNLIWAGIAVFSITTRRRRRLLLDRLTMAPYAQSEFERFRGAGTKDRPKGKFGRFMKHISVALGREPESLDLSKRHPFDLSLVRIPKGKFLCPYHAHAAESELYLVVSGRGSVRDKDGTTEVGPGDAFFFQPGEAHQLWNAGDEDFVYYVIADNPRSGGSTGDSCYYPDSGKWAVTTDGREEVVVKGTETDYFDGEE